MRLVTPVSDPRFSPVDNYLLEDPANLTLNRCSDNWEAYRDFVRAHNEGVINAKAPTPGNLIAPR